MLKQTQLDRLLIVLEAAANGATLVAHPETAKILQPFFNQKIEVNEYVLCGSLYAVDMRQFEYMQPFTVKGGE